MARRKGSREATAGSGKPSRPAEQAEQLDEFCRGLYPILLEGDPAAFRRYLGKWEDIVGDTAELAETPPEQQRRTMAAMLHHPQRFNLPPWPEGSGSWSSPNAPHAATASAARRTDELSWRDAAAPANGAAGQHVTRERCATSARPHPEVVEAAGRAQRTPASAAQPPPEARARSEPAQPAGFFQLDMLTGELVPVPPVPPGSAQPVAGHPPAQGAVEVAPARRVRSQRRRPAGDLEQLAFW